MTGTIPIYGDYKYTTAGAFTPSTVHVHNTQLQFFFRKHLLDKAISVLKVGLPKSWDYSYFMYVLFVNGFEALVNTDKYGTICQHCGLKGYNVFYRPTNAIITNPLLKGIIEPEIGKQCVVVKLNPDYSGIMDIVNYYADMMALASEAVGVNFLNSKLAYVFTAGSKASASALEKMYDKIAQGEPSVVIDKGLLLQDGKPAWSAFQQNLGQTYIADRLLSDLRKIEAMFDTEIGIPNANTDKRERLISDEVNANNVETASRMDMIIDQMRKDFNEANEMFGLNLTVDWRHNPYEVDTTQTISTTTGGVA